MADTDFSCLFRARSSLSEEIAVRHRIPRAERERGVLENVVLAADGIMQ